MLGAISCLIEIIRTYLPKAREVLWEGNPIPSLVLQGGFPSDIEFQGALGEERRGVFWGLISKSIPKAWL